MDFWGDLFSRFAAQKHQTDSRCMVFAKCLVFVVTRMGCKCLLARNVTQHATRTQKNFTHILALMVRNRYCIELLRNRKQFLSTKLREDLLQNHTMTQNPYPMLQSLFCFLLCLFMQKQLHASLCCCNESIKIGSIDTRY